MVGASSSPSSSSSSGFSTLSLRLFLVLFNSDLLCDLDLDRRESNGQLFASLYTNAAALLRRRTGKRGASNDVDPSVGAIEKGSDMLDRVLRSDRNRFQPRRTGDVVHYHDWNGWRKESWRRLKGVEIMYHRQVPYGAMRGWGQFWARAHLALPTRVDNAQSMYY